MKNNVGSGHSRKKTISKTSVNQSNPIVKIHFVADQDLYLNKGSVQNTVNYISGFFAAVAALYERAGMYLQISGITVYENPDGFPEDSADEALSNFRTTFNPPNGDLAHLVALDNGNGGIAYLDVLCNENYKFGYSDIYTAYKSSNYGGKDVLNFISFILFGLVSGPKRIL